MPRVVDPESANASLLLKELDKVPDINPEHIPCVVTFSWLDSNFDLQTQCVVKGPYYIDVDVDVDEDEGRELVRLLRKNYAFGVAVITKKADTLLCQLQYWNSGSILICDAECKEGVYQATKRPEAISPDTSIIHSVMPSCYSLFETL